MERGFWPILEAPATHLNRKLLEEWKMAHLKQDWMPALDFRRTQDGHWILAPLEWVKWNRLPRAVHTLSFQEVKENWPEGSPLELSEVLQLFSNHDLWLNVIEKDVYWVNEFRDRIPAEWNKKIIATSPIKGFAKKLREAQPEWMFASDISTISQFLIFEGLFLESVPGFWADVFFSPIKIQERFVFSERLLQELLRRKLPVVVELRGNPLQLEVFAGFPLKGLVTSSPEVLSEVTLRFSK